MPENTGGVSLGKIILGVGCGIVVAVILLLGMCTLFVGKVAVDTSETLAKKEVAKRESLSRLEIRDVKGEHTSRDWMKITGRLYNGGTEPVQYIKVEASLYDSKGAQVDKKWTYAVSSDHLRPGESKSFDLLVGDADSIERFDVRVMTDEDVR